jgi:fatty-acyl-CoA synthase
VLATMMDAMMSVQLIMRHGRDQHRDSVVATFDGDAVVESSFAEVAAGAERLAGALGALGVEPGDRVGTFAWNHRAHMEAYLAVPAMGAVLHTVNIRLFADQIAYILNDAGDRVLLVDGSLTHLLEKVIPQLETVEHVIVIGEGDPAPIGRPTLDYDTIVGAAPDDFAWPEIEDGSPAAVCYTSGTTGMPKGVVYSHRSTFVHSLAARAVDAFGINQTDRILLLPPMFHANAWGLPYTAWMSGADLIMPGPHLQAQTIGRLVREQRATFTAMVPTLVNDLLVMHEEEPVELESLRVLVSGGSAVPESMIDRVRETWGVPILQGWGMTETSPLCALSVPPPGIEPESETAWRAKSGRPVPGVEVRLVGESGDATPHDGVSVGELQLRGPWVTGSYHNDPSPESFTDDGWLRTGDVGTIDERGYVQLTDRTKDVIKSGGEWISSVELENRLVAHPEVLEATVIAIPDERWQERPLAVIVPRGTSPADPAMLREFLVDQVARFWLPDKWAFVAELPKTSVGKIDKPALRAMHSAGEIEVQDST